VALRIVMMGTGTFALPTFQKLIESDHDVVGLVTQPDRTGRGHHHHVNEMKEAALEAGVDVFQPEKVNTSEALQRLREFQADIFVVAAYGQILSKELLEIPRLGAINLHGSLLPKYRGAAPVQFAVLNGEKESGVTIFQIEPKLDAGEILGMVTTEIGPKETSGQLHDRLAELSAPLTLDMLQQLEAGTETRQLQDASLVTRAPKITKQAGLIDWSKPTKEIPWHIYGMQPWPMPFTFLHLPEKKPQRLLILDIDPAGDGGNGLAPGDCVVRDCQFLVRTGDGFVRVNTLQPAGKRAMSAEDFLRGTHVDGAKLAADNY